MSDAEEIEGIARANALADQIATEALRERAIGAASKALAWLETEPHGDLAANSARAGLIAGQAAVDAAAATLAGRAEALRELLDEALLWVPGHVHAHFLERRAAALADTPAPGWREYTVEPDVPDGVMVLCRSEEACERHIANPADRHLTLGEAADWAQAHARRHAAEDAEYHYDLTAPQHNVIVPDTNISAMAQLDPASPPAVDCPLPLCSGKAGRWCTGIGDDVAGHVHDERAALVFAPTIRRGGQPMPLLPDMHDLFAAPELADGPTVPHPAECLCPDEMEYGVDCPPHKPEPDACQGCGGLEGTHLFRTCNGAPRPKGT